MNTDSMSNNCADQPVHNLQHVQGSRRVAAAAKLCYYLSIVDHPVM
jgi:hypothetical protein